MRRTWAHNNDALDGVRKYIEEHDSFKVASDDEANTGSRERFIEEASAEDHEYIYEFG
jgi:hypothetical protein